MRVHSIFIHTSGARIQRMTYRQKEGWYVVPLDIETPVIEFEPTNEGRDKAFAEFPRLSQEWKAKKKTVAASKSKKSKTAKVTAPAEDEKEKESDEDDEDSDTDEKEAPDETPDA